MYSFKTLHKLFLFLPIFLTIYFVTKCDTHKHSMQLRFKNVQTLREGRNGTVFKGEDVHNGNVVALKRVKMNQNEKGVPSSILREVTVMKNLNHMNILPLKDVLNDGSDIILVLEYIEQTLHDIFVSNNPKFLEPKVIQSYSYQLLSGICYMHSAGYIHRDLNPNNILLTNAGLLKIGEMGRARVYHHPMKKMQIKTDNICYAAPELLVGSDIYDLGIDTWSAGCIIAEMVRGKILFNGNSPSELIPLICSTLGVPSDAEWPGFSERLSKLGVKCVSSSTDFVSIFPSGTDDNLIDLLRKLLAVNPNHRITAKEALNHPYFEDLSSSMISE